MSGAGQCTNTFFGSDPAYGVAKSCQLLASNTTTGTASTASLGWAPSSDADLVGYRVYYGTASRTYLQARGAGISTGKTAAFTATGLQSGQRYYFSVTAYDAAGNESAYSAEVSKLAQ